MDGLNLLAVVDAFGDGSAIILIKTAKKNLSKVPTLPRVLDLRNLFDNGAASVRSEKEYHDYKSK